MMRHRLWIAGGVVGMALIGAVGATASPDTSRIVHPVRLQVAEGESWQDLADVCGGVSAVELATQNGITDHHPLYDPPAGWIINCLPGEVTPSTTTTTGSETSAPTTTVPPATTEVPSTTGSPSPTTSPPPSSTTSSPTSTAATTSTTQPPVGVQFAETFTGNTGEDRFTEILHNRGDAAATSWPGDHDMSTPCGDPTTSRTVHHDAIDEHIYVCRDHVMQSLGHVSGYDVVAMCPDVDDIEGCDGFTADSVSWDVNVTNLHGRQWWEVKIVPVDGPDLSVQHDFAEANGGPANLPEYPEPSVIVGNGPSGGDFHVHAAGVDRNPSEWRHVCSQDANLQQYDLGGAACFSKATRLPFKVTDNRDGTVTLAAFGEVYTFAGEFPPVYKVVIASHTYTPLKDGPVPGHSWHWDNVRIG